MSDLIDRQKAIDALEEPPKVPDTWSDESAIGEREQWEKDVKALNSLPSAQPEYDLSGYSDKLWKAAYERGKAEAQRTGRWIGREFGYCSCCGHEGCASDIWSGCENMFCPNCGAKMEVKE